MPKITISDFLESFGAEANSMTQECIDLINSKNFNYEVVECNRRDEIILDVLKKIESDKQVVGAIERKDIWNNGWTENLQEFISSGYDLQKLVPKFIRPNKIIRYKQKYIWPADPDFELNFYLVFRGWLFARYFKKFSNIYEFGCGTGFNLVALSQMYPDKCLYGTDFVKSSVDLVNVVSKAYNIKLKGAIFDMINPDETFRLRKNSLIFTIGSIEQLASKFEDFLQYLLRNQPELCVHVEPTVELFDESILIDYLAIKFYKKRGYTQGFLPRLQELENKGVIDILNVKRLFFGSLFMEGYNLIIWRPVK